MAVADKPNNNIVDRKSSEYLAQLLNDKKQLQVLPNVFVHVEKILDEGRAWLFDSYYPQNYTKPSCSIIALVTIFFCPSYSTVLLSVSVQCSLSEQRVRARRPGRPQGVWCRSARNGLHKIANEVLLRVRIRVRVKVRFRLAVLWSPLRALLYQTRPQINCGLRKVKCRSLCWHRSQTLAV